MLDKLKSFIAEYQLVEPNDRLLLAVSGGKDSVVMAHLFHQLDYAFAIAHCNFKLRAEDSDEDEKNDSDSSKEDNLISSIELTLTDISVDENSVDTESDKEN